MATTLPLYPIESISVDSIGSIEHKIIHAILSDFPYTEHEIKLVQINPVYVGSRYSHNSEPHKFITIISSQFTYTALTTYVNIYALNENNISMFIHSMTLEEFYKYQYLLKNFSPSPHQVGLAGNTYHDAYIYKTLNNYHMYQAIVNKTRNPVQYDTYHRIPFSDPYYYLVEKIQTAYTYVSMLILQYLQNVKLPAKFNLPNSLDTLKQQ